MRGIFGIVGLLVVLAIIGVVAKKQLSSGATPAASVSGAPTLTGTPKQQVDQFQQAVQGAMQQTPRTTPDDSK